jgi:hypothetical protein
MQRLRCIADGDCARRAARVGVQSEREGQSRCGVHEAAETRAEGGAEFGEEAGVVERLHARRFFGRRHHTSEYSPAAPP